MAQARRNRKNKTPAWVWLLIGMLLGFFFSHVDFLQAYHFLETVIEKKQSQSAVMATRHPPLKETKFDFYDILSEKSSARESKLDLDEPKERVAERTKQPQHVLSDLDAATHTRQPPLESRSVTRLPQLSKQTIKEGASNPLEQPKPGQPASKNPSMPSKEKPAEEGASELPDVIPSEPSEETPSTLEEKPRLPEKYTVQILTPSYAEADRLKAQLLLLGFQGIRVQKITQGQEIKFQMTVGQYADRLAAEAVKKKLQQQGVRGFIVPKMK